MPTITEMPQTTMSTEYVIRVRGQLDPKLSGWFGDLAIAHTADGDSLLTGRIVDQAALYGVLARCRDLGVTLISINRLPEGSSYREKGQTGDYHEQDTR